MSRDRESKPDTWPEYEGRRPVLVPGSPDPGVYVIVWDTEDGSPVTGKEVWLVHWHTPTDDEPRWETTRCGLHTVHSVDPLHMEPSLGCENGCPSHGWIRNGQWVPA